MKKIMMVVAAIMMVATMAQAACPEYEYAELKDMSTDELALAYFEVKGEQGNQVFETAMGKTDYQYEKCRQMADKIWRIIIKRKNVSKKNFEIIEKADLLVAVAFDMVMGNKAK